MNYYCDPEDYLERANVCMKHADPKHLFYAAFELRSYVESRQNQYLLAQKKFRSSLPKRWKIGKQATVLDQIFKRSSKQKLTVTLPNGTTVPCLFVPVRAELQQQAEQLGDLLHSRSSSPSKKEIYGIRSRLKSTLRLAEECQTGNMLCPAIRDPKTGMTHFSASILLDETNDQLLEQMPSRTEMSVLVEYLDFK